MVRRPPEETGETTERLGSVLLPRPDISPQRQVARRLLAAVAVLWITVLLVYLDRGGYVDNADSDVTFLDCLYYTTVTLSTTGYGDITPASDSARLVNILVITPLRVLFLIILIGTTLEALTDRTRQQWRLNRWSPRLRATTPSSSDSAPRAAPPSRPCCRRGWAATRSSSSIRTGTPSRPPTRRGSPGSRATPPAARC